MRLKQTDEMKSLSKRGAIWYRSWEKCGVGHGDTKVEYNVSRQSCTARWLPKKVGEAPWQLATWSKEKGWVFKENGWKETGK